MSPTGEVPTLLDALKRGRQAVDAHVALAEEFGSSWREETVSEILWVHSAPFVRFADFTRHQERAVGADWLWWWVDPDGVSFGMLAQAKRIHWREDVAQLDLRANGGEQMVNLLRSADLIGVPASYVIYFGRSRWFRQLCEANHGACDKCNRLGVTVWPALEAQLAAMSPSPRDVANLAYNQAVPMEDLADLSTGRAPVLDVNVGGLDSQLEEFLREGQTGAKHVARAIFSIVARSRVGQFSAATKERLRTEYDSPGYFPSYPSDRAHYGVSYFEHLLRGLRVRPPSYIEDILSGRSPAQVVIPRLAGIVVVQC